MYLLLFNGGKCTKAAHTWENPGMWRVWSLSILHLKDLAELQLQWDEVSCTFPSLPLTLMWLYSDHACTWFIRLPPSTHPKKCRFKSQRRCFNNIHNLFIAHNQGELKNKKTVPVGTTLIKSLELPLLMCSQDPTKMTENMTVYFLKSDGRGPGRGEWS